MKASDITEVFLALLLFVVALTISVWLRVRSDGKVAITNTDIVVALVPIAIFLIVFGRLSEFGIGDFKMKLVSAYQEPVADQTLKPGAASVKDRSREVSILYLGTSCPMGESMIDKSAGLPKSIPYRYVAIFSDCTKNGDSPGRLYGIIAADVVQRRFFEDTKESKAQLFEWLRTPKVEEFKQLPSFVSEKDGVTSDTTKFQALKKMDTLAVGALPVVDARGGLVGVVERVPLVSSLLVDVGTALKLDSKK